MQYLNLGRSGLKVSRICLGMMSYGNRADRAWHLVEAGARSIVRRAVEAGVLFFDTADMYDDGASEEVTGRLLAELFARRDDYVLATKVFFPMGTGPNDRGLSRSTSSLRLMPHCGGSARTMSTCTRSTGGTMRHRSTRPWRRCMKWCGRARLVT
jgi:aryl-alcohol dehydrogenase-like predicted oxidoreductase